MLKATGKEKIKYTHTYTEAEGATRWDHRDETEKHFDENIVMHTTVDNMLPPGKHKYTFQYQLPSVLPGVFSLKDFTEGEIENLNAEIKYKLKATLDVGGFFATDFKAVCDLLVHEKPVATNEGSKTKKVRLLCCVNKGSCTINAATDKNLYFTNESAKIECTITNNSNVNVDTIHCSIYQVITGHLGWTERSFTRKLAYRKKVDGVAVNHSAQYSLSAPLNCEKFTLLPSTQGKLIACASYFVVTAVVSWCPNVRLKLPTTIVVPGPPHAGWVPELTEEYLAVNPIATTEAQDAKAVVTPGSAINMEDIRPANLVQEEETQLPVETKETVTDAGEVQPEAIAVVLDSKLEA